MSIQRDVEAILNEKPDTAARELYDELKKINPLVNKGTVFSYHNQYKFYTRKCRANLDFVYGKLEVRELELTHSQQLVLEYKEAADQLQILKVLLTKILDKPKETEE
jgi:hypothetical protein